MANILLTCGGAKWFKVSQEATTVEERDRAWTDEIAQNGVFVGHFVHSLDPKNRLTIPAEWRELVGVQKRLFVLPGIKVKCLCVYPAPEMTRRLERLRTLSIADDRGRQFARTLASRSQWVPWDSQGRIRVKDDLLEFADLQNQVVLVGTFDGFELWSPDSWRETQEGVDQSTVEEAARQIGF